MVSTQSLDEARRARPLANDQLRTRLAASHINSFVAIEPESGDYFLGDIGRQ